MIENRNLILAVVLSVAILLVSDFFFKLTRPAPPPGTQETAEQKQAKQPPNASSTSNIPAPASNLQSRKLNPAIPIPPGSVIQDNTAKTRSTVISKGGRIRIDTPRLRGSIALKGGIIDDLLLTNYRETLDPKSDEIIIFTPKDMNNAYYAQFGWVPNGKFSVPNEETIWQSDSRVMSPERPVTLSWNNGEGLVFKRTYSIDANYMFTITQEVRGSNKDPKTLNAYGLVSRRGTPETTGFYILHEGLLGVFNDTLTEIDYDDIQESGQIKQASVGGWIGITDKYWLAALVPDQNSTNNTRFIYSKQNDIDTYQIDYVSPLQTVAAGVTARAVNHLFVGAKEVRLLDSYEESLGVKRFDLAIDFGWFYFLTKPIFYALLWINNHVLNLGVSILLLTVCIKLLFFPLANKSYASMSKMKKLQPKIMKLRERHGDDKMKMNQEMMDLYKKEKVNPASGCLPILVQIPVFFALYKVLFVTIEMRHAPFFGWILDLSAPDPTTMFNLFGIIPWSPPEFLMIGVWPLIMGATMYLQQKLNPQPADPVQAKIFMFLPLFFTFLLAQFPAGLVIYWAWNNLLSILQQWVIMRRMGLTGKQALQ
ncbi:MAG: membrane protein insertase YidC [Magnetovibrio sp.]|nr:membrane protein insertase YidC [Magnetovibrio sp.]